MRVSEASNAAEVAVLLNEVVSLFGADAAAYASFIKDDETYESYRFIVACDPAWCLEYESGAYYMHDPWFEYARHHTEPCLAERLTPKTDQERRAVELAHRYGFASAIIVPVQAPQGLTRLGALCIGSTVHDYFANERWSALTWAAVPLAQHLHEWHIAQLRQELLDRAKLSNDELALLQHEIQGHNSKRIARTIKLSPTAIDSRWQRLNAKLGVSSRAAAARLAAEYGLV